MIRELFKERQNLSSVASEILRSKDVKEALPVFRVHIHSAYVLPANYGVYQHYYQPNNYFAIIKRWRQDIDLNKLKNPTERLKYPEYLEPTIEKFSFELRTEFIQKVLDELKVIKLPIWVGDLPRGLDRIKYEIEFGGLFLW